MAVPHKGADFSTIPPEWTGWWMACDGSTLRGWEVWGGRASRCKAMQRSFLCGQFIPRPIPFHTGSLYGGDIPMICKYVFYISWSMFGREKESSVDCFQSGGEFPPGGPWLFRSRDLETKYPASDAWESWWKSSNCLVETSWFECLHSIVNLSIVRAPPRLGRLQSQRIAAEFVHPWARVVEPLYTKGFFQYPK